MAVYAAQSSSDMDFWSDGFVFLGISQIGYFVICWSFCGILTSLKELLTSFISGSENMVVSCSPFLTLETGGIGVVVTVMPLIRFGSWITFNLWPFNLICFGNGSLKIILDKQMKADKTLYLKI